MSQKCGPVSCGTCLKLTYTMYLTLAANRYHNNNNYYYNSENRPHTDTDIPSRG